MSERWWFALERGHTINLDGRYRVTVILLVITVILLAVVVVLQLLLWRRTVKVDFSPLQTAIGSAEKSYERTDRSIRRRSGRAGTRHPPPPDSHGRS